METRIIKTKFWSDPSVMELSANAKYLFIYLLTCPQINMVGIFEISDKLLSFNTRLTEDELKNAKDELVKSGRCGFLGSWAIVLNATKNNQYMNSPKNHQNLLRQIESIPEEVKNFIKNNYTSIYTTIYTTITTTIHTTIHSSLNTKYKKEGGYGGKQTNTFSEDRYPFSTLWDVTDYNLANPDHKTKISNAIRSEMYTLHPDWEPPKNTPPELVKLFNDQRGRGNV